MPWSRFLVANVVGSALWSAGYGYGAELLGETLKRVAGPVAIGLGVLVAAAVIAGVLFVRHHEQRLAMRAQRVAARQSGT
jgi:membrane protein DedA with SNARE-associated domain